METNLITNLIAYMFIYSFVGWMLESIYKTYYYKKLVNSGFLIGPICPIYGFGAAIMYVCLNYFKDNIVVLFILGVIILSIWEYIVGILLEKLFKTKYWDYSDSKFNFQGRLCLANSLAWGFLGVIFIKLIHPTVQDIIGKISTNVLIAIDIVLGSIFIVDLIYSVIKVKDINIGIDKLVEVTDTIKAKMEELRNLSGKEKTNEKKLESLTKIIKDLKEKQASLKKSVSVKMSRLKMAFPSMKSEKITRLLNKKIDIIGILKNDTKNTKIDDKK